jgi:prepilin-type N-terminal cleavage/methylation domain-containing protein
MTRARPNRGGFTLIELLIVILVIGILMGLLLPMITAALDLAQKNKTQNIIKNLALACENYKIDFGVYPPSKPRVPADSSIPKTDPNSGEMYSPLTDTPGAANLVYYLCGPGGAGWGTQAGGLVPLPGYPNRRQYGPYVNRSDLTIDSHTSGTTTVLDGFMDGYNPPGRILYWRYDGTMVGSGTSAAPVGYTVTDNGPGDAMYQRVNFSTQPRFNDVATVSGSGTGAKTRWQTSTFILMSPGRDGHYGYTKTNKTNGEIVAASASDKADATYNAPTAPDDPTNY